MMRTILGMAVVGVLAGAAMGQVVVEGPRYQYGRYNEVFYGGRNPQFTSNAYVYLPPALQVPYAAHRRDTPVFFNGYSPMGQGGPFVSPYSVEGSVSTQQYVPFIFTDYLPFVEAGQFGFTVDQARNEAYANVPRLQMGYIPAAAEGGAGTMGAAEAPMGSVTEAAGPPADPKLKAIPLLNWAKAERTRNPALFKALVTEARKWDAPAASSLEQSSASEK
jgi:hypothetical protein